MMGVEDEILKLTTDFVFKRVSGDTSNGAFLIFIIQTLTKINVTRLEFAPQEIPREKDNLKTVIYDVAVKINDGIRIELEMQRNFQKGLIKRLFYYGTRLIRLEMGKEYHELSKGIVITFVTDHSHFFPHPVSVYVQGEWKNNPGHVLTDALVFYFIAMNRIDEIEKTRENEDLLLLLQFLRSTRREEMEALARKNENIKQAYEDLVQISQDPEIRTLAVARDKFLWDQEIREQEAEKRVIEAKKE